ncbi:MAG: hypothetical protein G01um101430_270 [Parcubacteria group bacterium Gr01-1014_30]|nr:MAG: hypothetical protein G01um101430_270 [Parcubacteria group bacterium Gr01-1014_30]
MRKVLPRRGCLAIIILLYFIYMTTQALTQKIEKLEKEILLLKEPKSILAKVHVDEELVQKAKKALFNFDIEKFVSKKDLKAWK